VRVNFGVDPKSLQDFLDACERAEGDIGREMRATLREVGEVVRVRGAALAAAKHGKTAAGYRTKVRARGVAVEQTLGKTTGDRPEWGVWQMRHALVPALRASESQIDREFEEAANEVATRFERG